MVEFYLIKRRQEVGRPITSHLSHNLHFLKSAAVHELKLLNDVNPILFRLQMPDGAILFCCHSVELVDKSAVHVFQHINEYENQVRG